MIADTHSHIHAPEPRRLRLLDNLGIAASSLCLVHCLALPIVLTFLPLLGWQFLLRHETHRLLAAFVVSFALMAVVPGYLKHRSRFVLAGMVAGVIAVLLATFWLGSLPDDRYELPLITAGNLLVVAAHLRNRALCKC